LINKKITKKASSAAARGRRERNRVITFIHMITILAKPTHTRPRGFTHISKQLFININYNHKA
jgi:hypothetical protein